VADLGVFTADSKSTREWIDEQTETPRREREAKARVKRAGLFAEQIVNVSTRKATGSRAARLEEQIARLVGRTADSSGVV
jgi:hypothetical protein